MEKNEFLIMQLEFEEYLNDKLPEIIKEISVLFPQIDEFHIEINHEDIENDYEVHCVID